MTGLLVILVLLVLVGPLAVYYGRDSRQIDRDERGWWAGSPRKRL